MSVTEDHMSVQTPQREGATAKIPFLDLQAQYASVRNEIIEAITSVADSTRYALGPEVNEFEERLQLSAP